MNEVPFNERLREEIERSESKETNMEKDNRTSGSLHTGGVDMPRDRDTGMELPRNVASDKEIMTALRVVNTDLEKMLARAKESRRVVQENYTDLQLAYRELLGKAGIALEEGLVNKPPWLIIKSPSEGELSQGDTDQSQPNKQ